MEENEHIAALKNGNRIAFDLLVQRYAEKVLNLANRFLHNETDAEDVTQEVFTTVFLSISGFKGDSLLSTWIYRITLHKCQEHLRKKQRKKRFGFLIPTDQLSEKGIELVSETKNPEEIMSQDERVAFIYAQIGRLPENQRIVFTLHKLEGMSYTEITEVTDFSLSSVESLMFRAKKQLKYSLSDLFKENES